MRLNESHAPCGINIGMNFSTRLYSRISTDGHLTSERATSPQRRFPTIKCIENTLKRYPEYFSEAF